jgi:hypothetical protein
VAQPSGASGDIANFQRIFDWQALHYGLGFIHPTPTTMSLHAELSQEALERLHAQRRNSTISSIVIAFLVVVLFALFLGIFLLPSLVQETPTIVTYEANLNEETTDDDKKIDTRVTRRPTPPSHSLAKVIVSNTASPTSVQVPDVDVTTPSMDFGSLEEFGTVGVRVARMDSATCRHP